MKILRLEKDKIIEENIIKHVRKPVRVGNFWSNNYIEYESNIDRNKTLFVEEYLNKIRPFLKYIIHDLKKSVWKIQINDSS